MPQHRILRGATRHRRRSPLRARLLSTRSSCFPAHDLHLHRLVTLLLVLGASSTVPVKAQSAAAPAQTVVRYHYGDDADGHLGWARRDFDDSSWPHRFPWPPACASLCLRWLSMDTRTGPRAGRRRRTVGSAVACLAQWTRCAGALLERAGNSASAEWSPVERADDARVFASPNPVNTSLCLSGEPRSLLS
jgi:hypothetical protein